jgi:hypothetical protein
LVTSREVYKVIAKAKKERLAVLLLVLVKHRREYTTDDNSHVNILFIAPYSQIDLAFMVVTSYRKTVSVAMCFVASEEEAMPMASQ